MVDWWTDEDRSEFGKRTKALIEQYNEFEPKELPGHHVNGEFTIGENIGDLGGLSIAIAAYKIATEGTGTSGHRRTHRLAARVLRVGAGMAHEGP